MASCYADMTWMIPCNAQLVIRVLYAFFKKTKKPNFLSLTLILIHSFTQYMSLDFTVAAAGIQLLQLHFY